jgi:hypothetical protein
VLDETAIQIFKVTINRQIDIDSKSKATDLYGFGSILERNSTGKYVLGKYDIPYPGDDHPKRTHSSFTP